MKAGRPKKDPHTIETKEMIMDAAVNLIKSKGFANVTIKDICDKSGITKSLFYYYYRSKNDLFADFTNNSSRIIEHQLEQLLTLGSFTAKIKACINNYFLYAEKAGYEIVKQQYITQLEENNMPGFPSTTRFYNTVTLLIEHAQKNGEIYNTSSPKELSASLFHLSRGISFTWAMENGGFALSEAGMNAIDNLLMPKPGFDS